MTCDSWADANCRTIDPNMMQPEVASVEDVAEAKAVCGAGTSYACPLLEQCRELALSQQGGSGEHGVSAYGVHGGEWFGHLPRLVRPCGWCGEEMTPPSRGKPATFCGSTCRQAAKRSRDAASLRVRRARSAA